MKEFHCVQLIAEMYHTSSSQSEFVVGHFNAKYIYFEFRLFVLQILTKFRIQSFYHILLIRKDYVPRMMLFERAQKELVFCLKR
jgi:hypothetical protein